MTKESPEQGIQLCCSPLHEHLDGVCFDGLHTAAAGLLELAFLLKERSSEGATAEAAAEVTCLGTAVVWNSASQGSAEESRILPVAASVYAGD